MAFIYQEWRSIGAGVFAVAVIAGAYLLASGSAAPRRAEASSETALLTQIATKDSTGDGLPDWQKALYGIPTNATTTDYFGLGMTDGEAVEKGLIVPVATTPSAPATSANAPAASFGLSSPASGSLTDTFAKNFFSLYTTASKQNNGSISSDQINTLANQALAELSASVTPAPDFKTKADIKVAGSGVAAMKTYAINAEAIINKYDPHLPKSDLAYLGDYLNDSTDTSALTNLATIATFYREAATGLAAIPVPSELAATHLALVNSLARIGGEVGDFSRTDTDPLSAMLALGQHAQTVTGLAQVFNTLANGFAAAGVVIPSGAPGASFVNLRDSVSTKAP